MQWYAYLLIVLAVLVIAGLGLVAPRLRRRRPVPPAPERVPEAAPQVPVAPVEEAGPAVEEAAPQVVLEQPEPTAGRLVRLRARLARSQGPLRRGLLAVLARDPLHHQAVGG